MNNWIISDNCYYRQIFERYLNAKELETLFIEFCNAMVIVSNKYSLKLSEGEGNVKKHQLLARKSGLKGSNKSKNSYYSDKKQNIAMYIPNIGLVEGGVRISNHHVDIGTWAKQNPEWKFGISIIVDGEDRINSDRSLPPQTKVCIYEYVIKSNNEENDELLMEIADTIVKTQQEKTVIDLTQPPYSKLNGYLFSGSTFVDEWLKKHCNPILERIFRKIRM